jgi:MerR family transcriptional regulator, copper efflux regulator
VIAEMNIGKLAALAGVRTATVRFYERRGLLGVVPRTESGYRRYDEAAAHRLRFIKHAQELGFSLDEIRELLDLRVDDPASCQRVEVTARGKVRVIQQRIRELERMRQTLEGLVRSCQSRQTTNECPVLATLTETAHESTTA